jgi:hypothetical protein
VACPAKAARRYQGHSYRDAVLQSANPLAATTREAFGAGIDWFHGQRYSYQTHMNFALRQDSEPAGFFGFFPVFYVIRLIYWWM